MKTRLAAAYILFALSQAVLTTAFLLFGAVALLSGAYLAYEARKESAGTVYESHARFLIRTLWIGGLAVQFLAACLGAAALLAMVDASAFTNGDPQAMYIYLTQNKRLIDIAMLVSFVPAAVWWVNRCWRGLAALKKNAPVENVTTWL